MGERRPSIVGKRTEIRIVRNRPITKAMPDNIAVLAVDQTTGVIDGHKYHHAVGRLGACAALRGDGATAIALSKIAMPWMRQQGDMRAVALGLAFLGQAYFQTHNIVAAEGCYRESLELFQTTHGHLFLSFPLLGVAHMSVARGALRRTTTLLNAVTAIHELLGTTLVPAVRPWYAQMLNRVRGELTPDDYAHAWAHGEHLTPEQVITYARDTVSDPATRVTHADTRIPSGS